MTGMREMMAMNVMTHQHVANRVSLKQSPGRAECLVLHRFID